jgi:hypothetical protein
MPVLADGILGFGARGRLAGGDFRRHDFRAFGGSVLKRRNRLPLGNDLGAAHFAGCGSPAGRPISLSFANLSISRIRLARCVIHLLTAIACEKVGFTANPVATMSLKYTHRPGGSAHCPECKEAISRQANICPHCRSDLSKNEEWQTQKANGAGGCAALLVFGVVCTGMIGLSIRLWIG